VSANRLISDNDLEKFAVDWLSERLPSSWEVSLVPDGTLRVSGVNSFATIAVAARSSFGPRDVDALLGRLGRRLRTLARGIEILVVSPWLSARTRDLLAAEGIHFLDATGNALIRLDNPAVYIRTDGAAQDPWPAPRGKARVRGPKAARLLRWLLDVKPPYGVRELAGAAELTPGYVSRLLDALDDEALVERARRGGVERVDVEGLIRRWAATYDVFAANATRTFVAPMGHDPILARLAQSDHRIAITGSFAAARFASVARPALLAIYAEDIDGLAERLALLPAGHGANVALLTPFDSVVWERVGTAGGLTYVAAPQVAVDCLTGNGRMPAEGEATLGWMLEDEGRWRAGSLGAVRS